MNILPILLAPLALIPVLAPWPSGDAPAADAKARAARAVAAPIPPAPRFGLLDQGHRAPAQRQVSIEQHVIIRIAPARPEPRPRVPGPWKLGDDLKEKKLDGCIPIAAIAGIAPAEDDRLLLFLRDRRVMSAALDKSCRAEEFYSGAYVERNADGQLCPRRDRLQSRTGASCQVAKLNRLVPRR